LAVEQTEKIHPWVDKVHLEYMALKLYKLINYIQKSEEIHLDISIM
jgi:hypothetical protein